MLANTTFHPSPKDPFALEVNYWRDNKNRVCFITVKQIIGSMETVIYLDNEKEFERYLDSLQSGLKNVNNKVLQDNKGE